MPKERFFSPIPLINQAEVVLSEQEFHHLRHVMRMEEGEEVEIVNGQGVLAKGVIASIRKKEAHIELQTVNYTEKPVNTLILYQALPRIQRLDFIVEKGTELGMTHLYLFPGDKSERKGLTDKQLQGLKEQAISALKQCGRLFLPEIAWFGPIQSWPKFERNTYFGDLESEEYLKPGQGSVAFCVGPESGFSKNEIEALQQLGAEGRRLHPNILRTDTAAIAALAILTQP